MKYIKIILIMFLMAVLSSVEVFADGLCGYSGRLEGNLNGLNSNMSNAWSCLKSKSQEIGINIENRSALRTFKQQEDIYAQGRCKSGNIVSKAKAGSSYHNYGLAFDIYYENFYQEVDAGNFTKINQIAKIAKEECCLAWGGDWTSFKDYPHFQPKSQNIPSLESLRTKYKSELDNFFANNQVCRESGGSWQYTIGGNNTSGGGVGGASVSSYGDGTSNVTVKGLDLKEICEGRKEGETGLIKYDGVCDEKTGFQGLFDTIQALLSWLIRIAMIIGVFSLLVVGFRFLTANGNQNQMSEARSMLVNVVLGLFLSMSAFFIINFVFDILLIDDDYNYLKQVDS